MESPDRLATKARRAYEMGRIRVVALALLQVVPVVVIAAALGRGSASLLLAVPLALLCAGLLYYGRGLQHAVRPGLIAGAIPMIAAMSTMMCANGSRECAHWCVLTCAGSGLIVGAWLGIAVLARRRSGVGLAAVVVAALTAAMGCLPIGLGTLVGVLAGLATGLAPAWVLRRSTDG